MKISIDFNKRKRTGISKILIKIIKLVKQHGHKIERYRTISSIFILTVMLLSTRVPFKKDDNKIEVNTGASTSESTLRSYTTKKGTREEFSMDFKEFIMPIIAKDTLFNNMPKEDLAILLNILAITESSGKNDDGYWYVMHSPIAKNYNIFGMKARKGQRKSKYRTWEEEDGKRTVVKSYFAVFDSYEESVENWLKIIGTTKYAPSSSNDGNILIKAWSRKPNETWLYSIGTLRYSRVINAYSWSEALTNLQLCGYMTDTKYPSKGARIYKKSIKEAYNR